MKKTTAKVITLADARKKGTKIRPARASTPPPAVSGSRLPEKKAKPAPKGIVGEVVDVELSTVEKNDWNMNALAPHELESLEFGLNEEGWLRAFAMVVWGTDEKGERQNKIIDGEHRHGRAVKLGMTHGPAMFINGITRAEAIKWTVKLTMRRGVHKDEPLAAAVAEVVKEFTSPTIALELGVDQALVDEVLKRDAKLTRDVAFTATDGDEEEPDIEPSGEPDSQDGEIYKLGRHFLMCGDSTKQETHEALLAAAKLKHVDMVFTDPPFAIYGSSTGLGESITDDKIVRPFFRSILEMAQRVLNYSGAAYVCCDWRSYPSWWEVSKGLHMDPKNLLVWDKGGGLGSNWRNTHELVVYFSKSKPRRIMKQAEASGIKLISGANVMRISRPTGDERAHNAAKPQELIRHIMVQTGDHVRTVMDFCGGSGQTLLACESIDRTCLIIDVDRAWCDVIRKRWTIRAKKANIDPGSGALE